MWQDGYRTPADAGASWQTHRRFLQDLFAVACPTTLRDLTDGEGAVVTRALQPAVLVVPVGPADLVLCDGQVPAADEVGRDTLALIRKWNGAGGVTELPNGLAAVAGANWQWLLGADALRWLQMYAAPQADAAAELHEVIEAQGQRIDLLERELLTARDEVAQLLPLLVSPKAQLHALRRSIPVSVRKRVPRRRTAGPGGPAAPKRDRALERLKGLSLEQVLAARFDEQWVGEPLADYVRQGLRRGDPVNAAHARVLAGSAEAQQTAPDWGPVELVTAAGRRGGAVPDLVASAAADLVTVDVWDTLIVRDRPADAAKLATARRMVLRPDVARAVPQDDVFDVMAKRVAVEARLAAADPMQEYLLEDVIAGTFQALGVVADEATVTALVQAEVGDEIAWTRARPDVATLAQHQSRLAIASDFYMSADHLQRIVAAADPTWADVPVYVSVDRGCSKRLGGGLLDLVRREQHVAPERHVHIGDNVHSDIAMQLAAGGTAIQVQAHSRFPAAGEFGPDDLLSCVAELRRQVAAFSAEHPTDDAYRSAGRDLAQLAVMVVARGLEKAYREQVDRIHYVSREGIFLATVHEAVEPLLRPPGAQAVRPVHLALSRRATFGASLHAPYRFSLQRMWSMYAKQSPRAMLLSIGVDPDDFREEVLAAGLDLDAVISDVRLDPRVDAFLADPEVERKLTAHVERARDLLSRYVLGRTTMTSPFIVADIGWRGTIHDNLVRALGIGSSFGVYFGLFPFLNAQPVGSQKVAVAFDGNLGEDFAFADPPAVLERPWTPDVPSTIGYRDEGGEVVPLFDQEAGHVSAGIAAFQQGSLEVAPLVARWLVGFGLTTTALRPQIAVWARELWENPPPGVADIWFSSDHDDSFGALNRTDFGKDRPGETWLQGDLLRHIRRGMASSGWPQGYRAWRPVASLIELGNLP